MWLPVAACEKPLYGCGLFSTRSLRLPRFLGIGAHKAGTSWLHVNLQAHPQLFLPRQKELHYFDSYFHSRTLRFYSGQFESADTKIRGEITPAYSILSPKRVWFIRKIMPDVRLIFIMRNPIDRSWSAALMDLLTLQNRTFDQVPEDEFYAHFKSQGARARNSYQAILDNWLSIFSKEQLHVTFFEEIIHRPRQLLEEVFEHIGVSCDVDWSTFPYTNKFHQGDPTPLPDHYRQVLEEQYRNEIAGLQARFGAALDGWTS